MGLEFANVGDLVDALIEDFEQDKVEQTQLRVDHPGVREFIEKAKRAQGEQHRTNIRLRETPDGQWVGLFELTPNDRIDVMGKQTSNIRHYESKVHFDSKEEAFLSSDETRIYDHVEEQVNGCITEQYENLDEAVMLTPLNSSDTKRIMGISGLIVPLAAGLEDSAGSFNGTTLRYQNGATTTTIQGTDRSDAANTRLPNFAMTRLGDGFNERTVKQLMDMKIKTKFRSIPKVKNGDGSMPSGRRFWAMGTSDYTQWHDFKNNTGSGKSADGDVGGTEDAPLHGHTPIYFPIIDQIDYNPLYLLDSRHIYARILADRKFKWLKAVNSRDGLEIFTKGQVTSVLIHCSNPRHAGGVLHDPIAA